MEERRWSWRLTLRFDTRSAVSSKVNWLIWSTIVEIFGLVDAVVDSHRREGALRWCCVDASKAEHAGLKEMRIDRAQHRAAAEEDKDMFAAVDSIWRWIWN